MLVISRMIVAQIDQPGGPASRTLESRVAPDHTLSGTGQSRGIDVRSVYYGALLSLLGALAACGGPKVLAGDSETVSITAGPLDDVGSVAASYCQRFDKQAEALGDRPLGPDTTQRLYDYNCIAPTEPAN